MDIKRLEKHASEGDLDAREALLVERIRRGTVKKLKVDKEQSLVAKTVTITNLRYFTLLEKLDLKNTHVSDLTPLASCAQLHTLHASGTRVSDLQPLSCKNSVSTQLSAS